MGKSHCDVKKDKDGETKVLFKKSNATMFSQHSRTFSGASQLYSRSGLLQLKKNLESNHHRNDGDKSKRDLSIETDICILRRYYRNKKNRLSGQDSSAKSRFSTLVDTEVETIEEFPDTSACGDNDTENKSNTHLDIASLMIDNLKDLLNHWIQKHLIENKDTKQKIDTVLDSLMQKLDAKINLGSTSGSTYVLDKEATRQEVKNKRVATSFITSENRKHKARSVKVGSSINISEKDSSSLTVPFKYKDIRIISTLSIPRSFHKKGLDEKKDLQNNSLYKIKKMKQKNIILSIDRSNKRIDSSGFDLVAISTKSLTKKCTNCDVNVKKKKRHIVFFPKPFYKSATESSSTTNNDNVKMHSVEINKHQLDDMPSLLKSLYANDPVITANLDKNIQYNTKNDNYTMTDNMSSEIIVSKVKINDVQNEIYVNQINEKCLHEKDQSDAVVAIDFMNRRIEFPNLKKSKSLNVSRNAKMKPRPYKKTSNRGKINKRKKRLANGIQPNLKQSKFQSIHNKQFTFLYKNANTRMSQGKEFLKHCQNIMEYFEDYDGNKNIKLDVRINVFPMFESRTKDVFTDISNPASGIYDVNGGATLLYNVQPTEIEKNTPVHIDEELIKSHTGLETGSCVYTPDIIPLLDGAVSETKYIFTVNSRENLDTVSKINVERSTLTSELEIVQEISELRAVIRDLAAAAERFVSEQLKKDSNKSNAETNVSRNLSNNIRSSSKVEAVINLCNPSKAIQYSKDFVEKQKPLSGLKITKEPKNKSPFDYFNKLGKKSTSYRIIDSESILKVTDMTSKGVNDYRGIDKTLTNSLPKSRSLFEMTSEQRNKQNLFALFCDGYQKGPQCHVCSVHPDPSSLRTSSTRSLGRQNKLCRKLFTWMKPKRETCRDAGPQQDLLNKLPPCVCESDTMSDESLDILRDSAPDSPPEPELIDCRYSSTICFAQDEEEGLIDDEQIMKDEILDDACIIKPKTCRGLRGMGFGEGCVYCMLLWIPVLIIICLFYGYVLKDKEGRKVGRQGPIMPIQRRNISSVLYVKLSDLGF